MTQLQTERARVIVRGTMTGAAGMPMKTGSKCGQGKSCECREQDPACQGGVVSQLDQ